MIVLLTDFGESEYVGIMKGVILTLDSRAQIVDLTHSIPSQSVREAAWILLHSYNYFPKNSLFVCVVDPGVGTERDAVLVETPDYVFIGPDNGILYPAVEDASIEHVYSIRIDPDISRTFHGRDIFAAAAGHYHSGESPREIGSAKRQLECKLVFYLSGRTGEIVHIDKFGNIITNLPPEYSERLQVDYEDAHYSLPLVETYADGPSQGLFLLVGSYGTIEIAAQNQSAVDILPVGIGEKITIKK